MSASVYPPVSFEREVLEHLAVVRERTASIEAKMHRVEDHEARIVVLEKSAWRRGGMFAAAMVVGTPVLAWVTDYVRVHILGVVFHPASGAEILHALIH